MNIIRFLNKMREYQFRENIIRNLKNQIEEKEKRLQELDQKLADAKTLMNECINAINQTPQSSVSTTFVNDLSNLLSGKYVYSEKEEAEGEAEEPTEEVMETEDPIQPSLADDIMYSNINDGNDRLSTVSFETDVTGLGIYPVCETNKRNHFCEINSSKDILDDLQLLAIEWIHDIYD